MSVVAIVVMEIQMVRMQVTGTEIREESHREQHHNNGSFSRAIDYRTGHIIAISFLSLPLH